MEETAPPNLPPPPEDIMTPRDSLEGNTTVNVAPLTPAAATGRDPVQISDGGEQATEAEPVTQFANFLQNKLLRKVGLASSVLLGLIAILVFGTLIFQKTHKINLSQGERIAQIQDQSVKLQDTTASQGPASLRTGVATMFVNGDVSVQGLLRLNNGGSYGQFDSSAVTSNQTYKLPNASGTICLDSGNCNYASAADLAAVQSSAAAAGAAAAAAGSLGAAPSATKYIGGSGVTITGSVITNSGVLSVNGSVGDINLQGTANQVVITNANGVSTFALPQDIGLSSTPTFGGLVLNSVGTQNGFNLCDQSNNCGYGINSIVQGGNHFGTDVIVGANDNSGLQLITNNTNRISITNNGGITIGGANSDRITALAQFSGSTPLVFQGATDDFFTTSLVITNPTSNRNIILPNADGTVCLSSGNCSGAGGYGDVLNGGNNYNSTMTLGTNDNFGLNLKTNNVNRITVSNTGTTVLLGNVTSAADVILGTDNTNRLTINSEITGATPFIFQGATNDSFATTFSITDPTANHNITFPNADGTVCLSSGNCTGPVGTGDVLQGGNSFGGTMILGTNDNFGFNFKTNNTTRLTISNAGAAAFSGDLTVSGNNVLGASSANRITFNGEVLGGQPLIFQGATDNAFATFLLVADPTATRTITLPNADGTICLSSGNCTTSGGSGDVNNGGNNFNSTMSLGTNDNFGLNLKTNNTTRLSISNGGQVTVQGNFIVNGDTLLGASSAQSVTFQAQNLFAPNDLNIDTYTQYIDTTNNQVGFGTLPLGTARVSILATNGGDALTVNNGQSAGNILNLQDNGVNVMTVANEGAATFRNSTNSVAAFKIQNASGATIVNTDTTNRTLSVNGGPSTYTFTPTGPVLNPAVAYTTGTRPYNVASGNFNGDAYPDLVTSNSSSANVSVLMNNGNGTFANKVDYAVNASVAPSPNYVAVGDFNGDGKDDIVSSNQDTNTISVLMNNGNGTFAAAVNYTTGTTPIKIITGDFNGDGKSDIAVANNGSTNISVFINNGNGTFANAVNYATTASKSPNGIVAADVNKDGKLDLVVSDEVVGTSSFSVFLGNGNGTFQSKVDYNTAASGTEDVKAADFNGDGYPDLVFADYYNGIISVYLNNGNGTFGGRVDYGSGSLSQYVAVGDFNGDGIQDIVSSNYISNSVSLLLGNGNGTFQSKVDYLPGGYVGGMAVGDFNQDGKLDLAVTNPVNVVVYVMLGNGSSTTVKNSLSVTTATANDTSLYIKAANGQSADLIRVADSNGSNAILGLSGTGAFFLKNTTNSTSALQLQNVAGTNVLSADTTNSRVGINLGSFVTPSNTLTVNGLTTADSLAQVAIGTGAAGNKGLVIQGVVSQTANLFGVQDSTGAIMASIGATGSALFKNSANSTTAFQIQNAAGSNLLAADTTNNQVSIGGAASATPTLFVFGQGNSASDPTGSNGAIYYNTSLGKLRCYQNGSWGNCAGAAGAGTGDVNNGGNNYGAAMSIGTLDNNSLSFITNGTTRGAFDTSGGFYLGNGITNASPSFNALLSATGSSAAGATGAALTIRGGAGATTGTGSSGGIVNLYGGAAGGSGNNNGGGFNFQGGQGVNLGNGGTVNLQGGGTDSGTGGSVSIDGGASTNGANGAVTIGTIYAPGITIGRSGVKTTINGVLYVGATGTAGTVEKFRINTPTTVDNSAVSILSTGATTSKGLVIQGVASQSANLLEAQDSTGSSLFSVSSAGNIVFGKEAAHTITVATSTTANTAGGALSVTAGAGVGSGAGGNLNLTAGGSGLTNGSTAGSVNITAGTSQASFGNAGNVTITAGQGFSSPGNITLQAGNNGFATYGTTSINTSGGRTLIGSSTSGFYLDSNINLTVAGGNITQKALAVPVISTVSTGTAYYYVVTAYNAQGETLPSTSVGMANNTSTITWSAIQGASGYKVYRNTSNLFTSGSLLLTTINAVATTAYTDTGTATGAGLPGTTTTGTKTIVQAWSGQTTNLQEWQTSTGTVMASIGASGAALYKNSANSTAALQIQNAAGTSLFTADTSNNQIKIGGVASATPTLFVFADGNSGTDPTGTNGAMYYNSSLGKFRCYQNGAWANCIGGGGAGTGDVNNGGNNYGSTMTLGTTDVQQLNFITSNSVRMSITSGGNVGLHNSSPGNVFSVNTPTTADSLAQALIATGATTNKGLVIQGVASQAANLFEVQDSTGAILASIGPASSGLLTVPVARVQSFGQFGSSTWAGSGTIRLPNNNAIAWRNAANTADFTLGLNAGNALQTAAPLSLNSGSAMGTVEKLRVNTPVTVDNAATAVVSTGATGNKGLVIQGVASQTANLTEWQGSTGTAVASVSASGVGSFSNLLQNSNQVCDNSNNCGYATAASVTLQGAYNNSSNPEITLGSGATKGITIRDNATPIAANLFEVQNNAGTIAYFKVDANGIVVTGSATITNGATISGGNLNVSTGTLQVAGVDRIDNTGSLVNVTYNGSTIAVAKGGTGATSLTQYGILFGNGTGGIQATAAGNSGQCLNAVTGSAPVWASCTPAATGNVNQGGNNFGTDVTLGATDNFGINLLANNIAVAKFSNTGQATFQNSVDSVTAMQVQNAAGTSLFTIDSTNSRVYVGNPTADGTGTLLVLDTKNTSGDPTGVNGAMYYNSNLGKFRCYEAGSWKDCIYSQQTATKTADQTFSATSYADVSDLSFSVLANKVYKLSCTLLVSVPSGTNGGNLSTNGPASPTQYTATFAKSLDQSSGDNYATSSSYDDASAATTFKVNTISTGSNRFIVNYNSILINGANSGTWSLRSKAFDGSSSITMYANSSCDLRPL